MRLVILSVILLIAATVIAVGVGQFSDAAGLITAGVLLAAWALIVFGQS